MQGSSIIHCLSGALLGHYMYLPFSGIGEVMLTPYDFSVITSLRLGSERIYVNDSLTSTEIKNYDWGAMTYATLLHFMTQLSRHSLSSLGGASFVWQVRFGIFGCVWVLESYFGYVVMVL